MRRLTIALLATACLGASSAAQAATTLIDFTEFAHTKPGPYGVDYYTRLESQGFEFTNSLSSLSVMARNHIYNSVDPAGATLLAHYGGITKLQRLGGGAFSLESFDFAEFTNNPSAGQILQVRYFDGVTEGLRTFQFDALRGAQTAALNLNNVQWVSFNTQSQFDNFRLGDAVSGAVPEPATWAMMILGFGAAGATLRRRRSIGAAVASA